MKKTMLFLLSIFIVGCVTVPPEQLKVQNIIDVLGKTKAVLYSKSLEWIATTFNSYKSVIEYKDQVQCKIIGNIVTTETAFLNTYNFKSRLTIDVKDNKARITFEPLTVSVYAAGDYVTTRGIYGDSERDMAHKSIESVKKSYISFLKNDNSNDSW